MLCGCIKDLKRCKGRLGGSAMPVWELLFPKTREEAEARLAADPPIDLPKHLEALKARSLELGGVMKVDIPLTPEALEQVKVIATRGFSGEYSKILEESGVTTSSQLIALGKAAIAERTGNQILRGHAQSMIMHFRENPAWQCTAGRMLLDLKRKNEPAFLQVQAAFKSIAEIFNGTVIADRDGIPSATFRTKSPQGGPEETARHVLKEAVKTTVVGIKDAPGPFGGIAHELIVQHFNDVPFPPQLKDHLDRVVIVPSPDPAGAKVSSDLPIVEAIILGPKSDRNAIEWYVTTGTFRYGERPPGDFGQNADNSWSVTVPGKLAELDYDAYMEMTKRFKTEAGKLEAKFLGPGLEHLEITESVFGMPKATFTGPKAEDLAYILFIKFNAKKIPISAKPYEDLDNKLLNRIGEDLKSVPAETFVNNRKPFVEFERGPDDKIISYTVYNTGNGESMRLVQWIEQQFEAEYAAESLPDKRARLKKVFERDYASIMKPLVQSLQQTEDGSKESAATWARVQRIDPELYEELGSVNTITQDTLDAEAIRRYEAVLLKYPQLAEIVTMFQDTIRAAPVTPEGGEEFTWV